MSAGRFVVVDAPYSERWSGNEWPARNNTPEGTKVISSAAHYSAAQGGQAYLGVRFPSASAAAAWVKDQCDEYDLLPSDYPRFTTVRDMEDYLSDCSYRGMFSG